MKPDKGLSQIQLIFIISIILITVVAIIYFAQQSITDKGITRIDAALEQQKTQREIDKLEAEIAKIRSEIEGGQFWIKVFGGLTAILSAVGGYLFAQDRSTKARLAFERRKDVDAAYQAIIKELSDESPLTRAAAAVKLGGLLKEFPEEWELTDNRKKQLASLTKSVLATALVLEPDKDDGGPSDLVKVITTAIAEHKPWNDIQDKTHPNYNKRNMSNLREIDFSNAHAQRAYWADVDATYCDFFRANLEGASFKRAILRGVAFYETNLTKTVFKQADCREAIFSGANLDGAMFDGAKVCGIHADKNIRRIDRDGDVDISPDDTPHMIPIRDWLKEFK